MFSAKKDFTTCTENSQRKRPMEKENRVDKKGTQGKRSAG
jgi:hypothetical protein